jgi:hypothetical protein
MRKLTSCQGKGQKRSQYSFDAGAVVRPGVGIDTQAGNAEHRRMHLRLASCVLRLASCVSRAIGLVTWPCPAGSLPGSAHEIRAVSDLLAVTL